MNDSTPKPEKPLGGRSYGSIPHLPGSRRGPADKGLSDHQAAILTEKVRDEYDLITVQEKLDGSNVAIANINGELVALTRAGYCAKDSRYEMHHRFADWVAQNLIRFKFLKPGQRICGEWLWEAHGTIYDLPHEPFVAFDIIENNKRLLFWRAKDQLDQYNIITPKLLHVGGAFSVENMLKVLEPSGHGATELVEGAVWRVERKGVVDFLGKYVRPEKVDGKYLSNISGKESILNKYE